MTDRSTKETGCADQPDPDGGFASINEAVQSLLRETYAAQQEELKDFADKVRYFNALKRCLRNELTQVRTQRTTLEPGAPPDAWVDPRPRVVFDRFPGFRKGGGAEIRSATQGEVQTKMELEEYIQGLEDELASVGDDAQLANIDLQNALQKQQQTVQMMSNVSKILHDTAMATIRKIG